MKSSTLKYAALAIVLLAPTLANAQGVLGGAADGADAGARSAGPVGAVVGGVVGGVAGGVNGLLGIDQRPRFHEYILREHPQSFAYDGSVQVGVVLPPDAVEYYDVPPEYGRTGYRYTVVDNEVVLVDPHTHAIVQVID
ncbi:MAG: DUF1236 domain-containing protein [Bradyrhizobium sp.]|nr:MAG: DUF1236 domain-containing protein [Bradyrhizobium sp.]